MSKGNTIVVSAEPRGRFVEGIIGVGLTPKPGTVMQIQGATALVGGRFTFELYAPGTDGDISPPYVLREDGLRGKLMTDAYAAGDRAFLYVPAVGDELNMLLKDVSGTADDHAVGELLLVDTGTGKLIADTGSPESKQFQLLEAVTDPTADTLAWCQFMGA